MGAIGLVANPASGKDVRRLTARASVFDNQEKAAIVRRCLAGIHAFGAGPVRYLPDSHRIVASAVVETGIDATPLEVPVTGTAADTTRAAAALRGAAAVVTLGGDGTNRAFARGWLDAPLIALSTGTNNAFPAMLEATAAGAAAALLGRGLVAAGDVSRRCKVVHVSIDGEEDDLALIDAVATTDRFVGSRAIVDPRTWTLAVLTRADPAAVGMTGVAGFLAPLAAGEDAGLALRFARPGRRTVRAAVAPGQFADVTVAEVRRVAFSEEVRLEGPATLAFDGERERTLAPGQRATFSVRRDGPRVIGVGDALGVAAAAGLLDCPRVPTE